MPRRSRPVPVDTGRLTPYLGPGPGPGGIVVLVPVLNRPDRVDPLVASLRETSDARLLFLLSPGDEREDRAVRKAAHRYANVATLRMFFRNAPGDYARKINTGVRETTEPWLLQAGDDLHFHPGWEEAALQLTDRFRVIGTNDLCNPRVRSGRHSTHSLVHRSYVDERGTADEDGKMLHEGYRHNFVDDEFIQTARRRREFGFAFDAHVEHLHPMRGATPLDQTYRLGQSGFADDRIMLARRRHLWR